MTLIYPRVVIRGPWCFFAALFRAGSRDSRGPSLSSGRACRRPARRLIRRSGRAACPRAQGLPPALLLSRCRAGSVAPRSTRAPTRCTPSSRTLPPFQFLRNSMRECFDQLDVELRGVVERDGPREGGEIRVAQLDVDGARVQFVLAQPAADHLRQPRQRRFEQRGVGGIFAERVLVADRFRIFPLADVGVEPAARVLPDGFAGQRQAPLAETFLQKSRSSAPGRRPCGCPDRAGSSRSPCRRPESCAHRAAPGTAPPVPAGSRARRSAWPDRK